jgi:hypothetical protein
MSGFDSTVSGCRNNTIGDSVESSSGARITRVGANGG